MILKFGFGWYIGFIYRFSSVWFIAVLIFCHMSCEFDFDIVGINQLKFNIPYLFSDTYIVYRVLGDKRKNYHITNSTFHKTNFGFSSNGYLPHLELKGYSVDHELCIKSSSLYWWRSIPHPLGVYPKHTVNYSVLQERCIANITKNKLYCESYTSVCVRHFILLSMLVECLMPLHTRIQSNSKNTKGSVQDWEWHSNSTTYYSKGSACEHSFINLYFFAV